MKLLVCGNYRIGKTSSRTPQYLAGVDTYYATQQRQFVYDYLLWLHQRSPITMVIAGDEGGAERLGLHWARVNGIPQITVKRIKFQQSTSRKLASFITGGRNSSVVESTLDRNQRMLYSYRPDTVVAFGDGNYTEQLLQDARELGIEVIHVEVHVTAFSGT